MHALGERVDGLLGWLDGGAVVDSFAGGGVECCKASEVAGCKVQVGVDKAFAEE